MARGRPLLLPCSVAALALVSAICGAADLPLIAANDNRRPAGKLESGTLTLRLEVREGEWHPGSPDGARTIPEIPGTIQTFSLAEEGRAPEMPGPLIRVPQGTELRVSVHNRLSVPVVIHGLNQHPANDDKVIQLAPDERKEVRFNAGQPGTYLYWAATSKNPKTGYAGVASSIRTRPATEVPMSGAFIVDGPNPHDDRVFVIQLWANHRFRPEVQGDLTINGKSWPYTERLQASLGVPERWRVVNTTPIEHPMHLHGFYFKVDGVGDGQSQHYYSAAERRTVVTESVPPGHTFDMTWFPERAGNWLFHCHILDHMSAYRSPVAYGPKGPPAGTMHPRHDDGAMGMAKLVLGITVSDNKPKLLPAKEVIRDIGASRHLIVRERPSGSGFLSRPGIYLEGASQSTGLIGPPLIMTQGAPTAVTVSNELQEPTAIHWHGIEIESYYDGVPGWNGTPQNTTPMIPPGGSFVAYMTPPRAGTFIYHTHWHNVEQLTGGVYGPLLVLPPDQKYDPATDKVFVLGRSGPNEFQDPLVLNGSSQPGVMFLLMGRTYRFRFINITPNDSPVAMSMTYASPLAAVAVPDATPKLREGEIAKWRALAKDGADLPAEQAHPQNANESLSVGETRDFVFDAQVPGQYVLRLRSPFGSEVGQVISVVPAGAPISVYAETR